MIEVVPPRSINYYRYKTSILYEKGEIIMKYSEATKVIQGLSNKYSINNNYKSVFELRYKYKSVAWVDKQEQFNFGRANIVASEFDKLPYSHKLWMILTELAMTKPSDRLNEPKYNVIIANIGFHIRTVWYKVDDQIDDQNLSYDVDTIDDDDLVLPEYKFTEKEYKELIKYIKTLPDGEWQAKVAERGKTDIKWRQTNNMEDKKCIEQCKFCHKPYDNLIDEAGWLLYLDKFKENGISYYDLVTETKQGFASAPAEFCPKCGRKLS